MITCKEDLKGKYVITRDKEVLQAFCYVCTMFGITTPSGMEIYQLGLEKPTIAYSYSDDGYVRGDSDSSFYKNEGLVPFTKDDLKFEPIWNNKKPKDMSKEEFARFVYDRVMGVDMQLYDTVWKKVALKDIILLDRCDSILSDYTYRVKPPLTKEDLQRMELEESIKLKQEELAKLQAELEDLKARA